MKTKEQMQTVANKLLKEIEELKKHLIHEETMHSEDVRIVKELATKIGQLATLLWVLKP